MPGPRRVVDAHVHHWDPARTDWYPFLTSDKALAGLGMSDVSRMRRRFDQQTYLAESVRWQVDKYVHVTAAVGHAVAETAELERLALETGRPNAIIGGVDAHDSAHDILSQLDEQGEAPHFRGVRVAEGLDHDSEAGQALLGALQERGLIYDLVVHPDDMLDVAETLESFDALTVVVEHTGWPLSEEAEHAEVWRAGMTRLAALGDRVHCKLSGLPMTVNRLDVEAFRPWVEHCLATFGDQRCFFASNFPVDGLFGDFDDLYSVYEQLVDALAPAAKEQLFADNAERVYRC